MAASIGYICMRRATTKPVAISVATVATMVARLTRVKAAISFSHGVMAAPMANSSG